MRVIHRILCLLGITFSLTNASAAPLPPLKVLTLNFNSEVVAFDDRGHALRDTRFRALTKYIHEASVDIVLIQEGWNYLGYPSVAIPLARALGYDYFYRISEGFPGLLYDSNIILTKKSLKMRQKRVTTLPHSAPHLGDGINWIIPLGLITRAVSVELTLPNGEPLFVVSSHLIGSTSAKRKDQVEAIDRLVHKYAAHNREPFEQANIIAGGDFNSTPDSPEMQRFKQLGYVDSWDAAHPGQDASGITNGANPNGPHFNPYTLGAGQLPAQAVADNEGRIDYIFQRGPHLRPISSTAIFTLPYDGQWMSDHYGVLTTFAINGSAAGEPVNNPLTDSDGSTAAPARVFTVTDDSFAECDNKIDCDLTAPAQLIDSPRGLAVVNKSTDKMHLEITGPGRVFSANKTTLSPGEVASFYLPTSGSYRLKILDGVGDSLTAPLRVPASL